MPRMKIYPTHAARTAAWRERKRQAKIQAHRHRAWTTPPDLFARLDAEFHFTVDVAADPTNALCTRFYTPEQDGLSQSWAGEVCWCNPPYREVGRWVRKAAEEAQAGALVVCLLRLDPTTQWWQTYIAGQAEVRPLRRRLQFGGAKHNAPFPFVVVIFRPAH